MHLEIAIALAAGLLGILAFAWYCTAALAPSRKATNAPPVDDGKTNATAGGVAASAAPDRLRHDELPANHVRLLELCRGAAAGEHGNSAGSTGGTGGTGVGGSRSKRRNKSKRRQQQAGQQQRQRICRGGSSGSAHCVGTGASKVPGSGRRVSSAMVQLIRTPDNDFDAIMDIVSAVSPPLLVRNFLSSPADIRALCIALGHRGSRCRGNAFDALASAVLGRGRLHTRRGLGFMRPAHAYPACGGHHHGGGGGYADGGPGGSSVPDAVRHRSRGDPLLDEAVRLLAAVHRDMVKFETEHTRAVRAFAGKGDTNAAKSPRDGAGAANDAAKRLRNYCSICHRSALDSLHLRVLALCLRRWQLGYAVKVLARATHHARPALLVARQRQQRQQRLQRQQEEPGAGRMKGGSSSGGLARTNTCDRAAVPLGAASPLATAYALVIHWAAAHGAGDRAASILRSAHAAGISGALGTDTWNAVLDALLLLPMALGGGSGEGDAGAENEGAEVAFSFIGKAVALMAQAGVNPDQTTNSLVAECLLKARARARLCQRSWQQRELNKLAQLKARRADAARRRAAARDLEEKEEREMVEERIRLESARATVARQAHDHHQQPPQPQPPQHQQHQPSPPPQQQQRQGAQGRHGRQQNHAAAAGKHRNRAGKMRQMQPPSPVLAGGRTPPRQPSPRGAHSRSPSGSLSSAGSDELRSGNNGGRPELPAFVPKPPPNAPDEEWEAWRRACARAREAKGGRPYHVDRRYRNQFHQQQRGHGRGGFAGGSNKLATEGRTGGIVDGPAVRRRSGSQGVGIVGAGLVPTKTPPLAPRPPPGPQNTPTLGPHVNVWTEKLEQRLLQQRVQQDGSPHQQPQQQPRQQALHRDTVDATHSSPQRALGAIGAGVIGNRRVRAGNAGTAVFGPSADMPPTLVLEPGRKSPPGFRAQSPPDSLSQQQVYGAAFDRASAAAEPAADQRLIPSVNSNNLDPNARAFVPARGPRPPSPATARDVVNDRDVGFFGECLPSSLGSPQTAGLSNAAALDDFDGGRGRNFGPHGAAPRLRRAGATAPPAVSIGASGGGSSGLGTQLSPLSRLLRKARTHSGPDDVLGAANSDGKSGTVPTSSNNSGVDTSDGARNGGSVAPTFEDSFMSNSALDLSFL